jgi:hypothetical protein
MNSNISAHFPIPAEIANRFDAALDHLGAWMDVELDSLEDLLGRSGYPESAEDIAALRGLHLDATADAREVEHLLTGAGAILEQLLQRVQGLPIAGTPAGPATADFDAWVCWSGARLADILTTIRRALIA